MNYQLPLQMNKFKKDENVQTIFKMKMFKHIMSLKINKYFVN